MNKPEVGDTIELKPSYSDGMPSKGTVIAVFDSLTQSWDPWGELAWAQSDVDEFHHQRGDWYAILETDEPGDGVWGVASYEVEHVTKASDDDEPDWNNRYMFCDICGVQRRVVKTTTVEEHRDPTEVYHLDCGHKII